MHLLMILLAFGIACLLRLSWSMVPHHPVRNCSIGLVMMVAPPIFVLMTCLSLVWMGPHGIGIPLWEGWLCYGLSLIILGYAIASGGLLTLQNWRFSHFIQTLPVEIVCQCRCRILEADALFSAICGWYTKDLVVSRGLINHLSKCHIEAIFAHENAHRHFNDLQHFSVIYWLKNIFPLFPNSTAIWRYLVIAREIRADRKAAQSVDPFNLADALLLVAKSPRLRASSSLPSITGDLDYSGLSLRIKALTEPESLPVPTSNLGLWIWIAVACCPLLLVPFHH